MANWANHLFFGLDLASPAKPSAAVALTKELGVAFCCSLGDDDQIIQTIASLQPRLVAIDAPLSLPPGMGLCCLEESSSCSCLPVKRKGEQELARRGIGCFYTTKKSIIKPLIKRGMNLKHRLKQEGYEVIEVYPYATKVLLWGRPIPKKTTAAGRDYLIKKLACLFPELPPKFIQEFNHDLADATLAAYTAYLHHHGRSQSLGDEEEGVVVIPRVTHPPGPLPLTREGGE